MKNLIVKCSIIVTVLLSMEVVCASVQSGGVELMIYLTSGILKNPIQIVSPELQSVFQRYGVTNTDVRCTYPNFREADTLRINAAGNEVISTNYSRFFTVTLRRAEDKLQFMRELHALPQVISVTEQKNINTTSPRDTTR